jgi:hypothetical protein
VNDPNVIPLKGKCLHCCKLVALCELTTYGKCEDCWVDAFCKSQNPRDYKMERLCLSSQDRHRARKHNSLADRG